MGGVEVARVEGGFVGVEKREDTEDLIVERAFEGGAADAVAEAAGFAPDFVQQAVDGFQSERPTSLRIGTVDYTSRFEIGRDKHRIPRNIHRLIDERSGARGTNFAHFLEGIEPSPHDCFCVAPKRLGDLLEITRNP